MTAIESRGEQVDGQSDGQSNGQGGPADVSALRREIAQTRADLGQTVEALAAKADVKARAHEAVDEAKARARSGLNEALARLQTSVRANPLPYAGAAALVVLLIARPWRWIRR
jgi:hypothetical protein